MHSTASAARGRPSSCHSAGAERLFCGCGCGKKHPQNKKIRPLGPEIFQVKLIGLKIRL